MAKKTPDYKIGDQFGDWTIVDHAEQKKDSQSTMVVVRCVCGKECIRVFSPIYTGRSKRCKSCAQGEGGYDLKRYSPNTERKFEALEKRNSGFCHEGGECHHYRYCGDKLFECDCRGRKDKVKMYANITTNAAVVHGGVL